MCAWSRWEIVWLLMVISQFYSFQDKKTFLLVLDAKTFEELGRANVPVNMPYGFHGTFSASAWIYFCLMFLMENTIQRKPNVVFMFHLRYFTLSLQPVIFRLNAPTFRPPKCQINIITVVLVWMVLSLCVCVKMWSRHLCRGNYHWSWARRWVWSDPWALSTQVIMQKWSPGAHGLKCWCHHIIKWMYQVFCNRFFFSEAVFCTTFISLFTTN